MSKSKYHKSYNSIRHSDFFPIHITLKINFTSLDPARELSSIIDNKYSLIQSINMTPQIGLPVKGLKSLRDWPTDLY